MASPSGDHARTFIAYLRVSTDRQGKSGLGLEAQQAAIQGFLRTTDRLLVTFTEVESGKNAGRVELHKALARCKAAGATLLVAKLDRLSRNLPFLRSLIDGGADVAFCDMPQVPAGAMGRFILTQMAAVAELEAGLISERTKAALSQAKARGVKLGGDRGYRPAAPPNAIKGAAASAEARQAKAARFRFGLLPMVQEMRNRGDSLRAIAAALESKGIVTSRSGKWTAMSVQRVLLTEQE
ncbi:resolvase [Siccirubricoccus deserti]|uniref:Recombinase family protein n=1 Tax=Siccirubricoccus deserti TaxID=2013562 RepID=A0A9X0UFQ1_9PROT|nr:recombinase family protein [Siccirubricoccus deserti]MBC4014620.1 recombinase family protein [Siccirubricoccus deserti]GGC31410.1 resolvase [Siccirubricoccus deserti]